jgi:mono/diheme cytochrome c family protein
MADALRTQAAKSGGFYVRRLATDDVAKVGRFLATYDLEAKDKDGNTVALSFHQKNPFLLLADYSAEVAASPAKAKFRLASDNYMNPANAPDLFEVAALTALRASGDKTEYWNLENGQLRYARALRATAACLSCHGDAAKAPSVVRSLYRPPVGSERGGGYGYQEGELVGLTSVTVPHMGPLQMLKSQGVGFWASAVVLLGLMGLSLFLLFRGVVLPIRRQTAYARALAAASDPHEVSPPSQSGTHADNNELTQALLSMNALNESLATAHDFINTTPPPSFQGSTSSVSPFALSSHSVPGRRGRHPDQRQPDFRNTDVGGSGLMPLTPLTRRPEAS